MMTFEHIPSLATSAKKTTKFKKIVINRVNIKPVTDKFLPKKTNNYNEKKKNATANKQPTMNTSNIAKDKSPYHHKARSLIIPGNHEKKSPSFMGKIISVNKANTNNLKTFSFNKTIVNRKDRAKSCTNHPNTTTSKNSKSIELRSRRQIRQNSKYTGQNNTINTSRTKSKDARNNTHLIGKPSNSNNSTIENKASPIKRLIPNKVIKTTNLKKYINKPSKKKDNESPLSTPRRDPFLSAVHKKNISKSVKTDKRNQQDSHGKLAKKNKFISTSQKKTFSKIAKIVPFHSKAKFVAISTPLMKTKARTKSVLNTSSNTSRGTIAGAILDYDKVKKEVKEKMQKDSQQKASITSPGTKVLKIESYSTPGYTNKIHKKINQDNFFVEKNYLGKHNNFLVGVCDGHGIYGHLCSEYISINYPKKLQSIIKSNIKNSEKENLIKSFNAFNSDLVSDTSVDTIFSGSTCTAVLLLEDKLSCASVGDSRAILVYHEKDKYEIKVLSRDHKLDLKDEADRIIKKGGEIHPYVDPNSMQEKGPKRVWVKNSDIPGLAMSRSFGDEIAHSIGVIAEPEVCDVKYTGNESFLVLASDGIWEFISNEECTQIVKTFYEADKDAKGAVNALVDEALKRWRKEESSIDDITAVIVFFE